MNSSTVVILGSARKHSDTEAFLRQLYQGQNYELIDLLDFAIHPYNYEETYPDDDQYLDVVERMLRHNRIILASPVYWYSLSGRIKTFMDRITDLLHRHKNLGRQLRGKSLGLVAVGGSPMPPEGFDAPVRLSAEYLGMHYLGLQYRDAHSYKAENRIP